MTMGCECDIKKTYASIFVEKNKIATVKISRIINCEVGHINRTWEGPHVTLAILSSQFSPYFTLFADSPNG